MARAPIKLDAVARFTLAPPGLAHVAGQFRQVQQLWPCQRETQQVARIQSGDFDA